MSFTAMAWASKQKTKTASQKLILLMLANYADDQDKCWPSKQTLADMCCMSKSGICKTISQLENFGFLRVEKRDGTSSLIRLNTGVHQVDRGCPPSGQGVSTKETGGVHPVDINLSMKQSGEPITEKNISSDLEFEEFWAAYPKRPNNPRKKALAAYNKARKKTSQENLLTAVGLYAAYMQGENPKFVAMASTWLNDERWNCDYSKGAEVIDAYKATKSPDVSDEFYNEVAEEYPGVVDADARRALADAVRSGVLPVDLTTAVAKFKVLQKVRRAEGFETSPPLLSNWVKFRWREMDGWEFCRSGMNNALSVRPKRKG